MAAFYLSVWRGKGVHLLPMRIARIIYKLLCFFLLIAFLSFIVLFFTWKNFLETPLITGKRQTLYVSPGSTIYSVAHTLGSRGILPHPQWFIWLARSEHQMHNLKAGEYLLEVGITPQTLLKKLVEGKVILRRFTLVEGWTLKQVFASMHANPYLLHTIANTKVTIDQICKKIGTDRRNIEGVLYPDTYLFAAGVSDMVIIKKAFWSMQRSLAKLWKKRDTSLSLEDPYSALIVASLIEKETARPDERAKIAGVIMRRLEKKMPLQIDAAVIYGLGNFYNGKLTREDLQMDTPYNTYLHVGLPPTPIAMPSLPSIVAALHPESGTSLYYVARGDGSHEFTDTLEAHHQAVKKYHPNYLELNRNGNTNGINLWFNDTDKQALDKLRPFLKLNF
jgi:UPF0755 protein